MPKLTFRNHSRIFANFTYVYPVVSRRSNGISLGINLNINNACNWRCVYCQVSGLMRGKPVYVDLIKLEEELDQMLNWIINGDFIKYYAPKGLQRFNDISLSGNGESTLSKQFLPTVEIIAKLRQKYCLSQDVKTILITNGSELDKVEVLKAINIMSENNGEIWFKIDSATENGINRINQVSLSIDSVLKRLITVSSICNTYIQTCFFKVDHINPSAIEVDAYVELIKKISKYITGVLIYSTARNPALPEGNNIFQVDEEFLAKIAERLLDFGVKEVKFYV